MAKTKEEWVQVLQPLFDKARARFIGKDADSVYKQRNLFLNEDVIPLFPHACLRTVKDIFIPRFGKSDKGDIVCMAIHVDFAAAPKLEDCQENAKQDAHEACPACNVEYLCGPVPVTSDGDHHPDWHETTRKKLVGKCKNQYAKAENIPEVPWTHHHVSTHTPAGELPDQLKKLMHKHMEKLIEDKVAEKLAAMTTSSDKTPKNTK